MTFVLSFLFMDSCTVYFNHLYFMTQIDIFSQKSPTFYQKSPTIDDTDRYILSTSDSQCLSCTVSFENRQLYCLFLSSLFSDKQTYSLYIRLLMSQLYRQCFNQTVVPSIFQIDSCNIYFYHIYFFSYLFLSSLFLSSLFLFMLIRQAPVR